MALASAEYRLHLPRLLMPDDAPTWPVVGKVRVRPEHVYGQPDWDFILRGFIDSAWVFKSDPLFFENDEWLVGAGIGAELKLLRYLSARVDLGWPLEKLANGSDGGDKPEVYGVLTVMY